MFAKTFTAFLSVVSIAGAALIGSIPLTSNVRVSAAVYDSTGQLIRTLLADSAFNADTLPLSWDGLDQYGNVLPKGNYEWRAIAGQVQSRDDGQVGQSAVVPYGPGAHSAGVNGVAFDPAGNCYEISYWEEFHSDLRKWNAEGKPVWGLNFVGGRALCAEDSFVYAVQENRSDVKKSVIVRLAAQFGDVRKWISSPSGYIAPDSCDPVQLNIAVDATRLWVSNGAKSRIEIYDKSSGALLVTFPAPSPRGIAADGSGKAWVANNGNRVTAFSATGTKVDEITGLQTPHGVVIGGPLKHLYVSEVTTGQVVEYDLSSKTRIRALFGAAVPGPISPTAFYWPTYGTASIAVDSKGAIVAADAGNCRVQYFNPNGTLNYTHSADFPPAPSTDPDVDPNMLLSKWIQYKIDYTAGSTYGKWSASHNWMPRPGLPWSTLSVMRRLSNGVVYCFYFGIGNGVAVYALEPTGMRFSTLITFDKELYIGIDADGNGLIDDVEKTKSTNTSGWGYIDWVDKTGNLWIAKSANSSVRLPIEGFDEKGNPVYHWEHHTTVVPSDTSPWGFAPNHLRIDPTTGDIYRLGTISQNRNTYGIFHMGGTAIERCSSDGKRISVFPIPALPANDYSDVTVVFATDSDGKFFYTGHDLGSNEFVRMYTNDGLLVTTCRVGAPNGNTAGWMDLFLGLTAFTHPSNNAKYIYAEDVYWSKSIRFRVDNANALSRFGTKFSWTQSEVVTVGVKADNRRAYESKPGLPAVLTVRRNSIAGNLKVRFALSGSATVNVDYRSSAQDSVVIADGKTEARITITPIDDANYEKGKTVIATILSGTGYQPGTKNDTVFIIDNDEVVTVAATIPSVSNAGSSSGEYTISRAHSDDDLTVRFSLSRPPVPIISATASSSFRSYTPEKAFDADRGTIWMNTGNADNESDHDDAPYILFQLDTLHQLDEMWVANFCSQENGRGPKDIDVQVSADRVTFVSVGIVSLISGPEVCPSPFQVRSLNGVAAKSVKFVILSNNFGTLFRQGKSYEGTWANRSSVGLAEVCFFEKGASVSDIKPVPDSVVLKAGSKTAAIQILPINTGIATGNSRLALSLLPNLCYTMGAPSVAYITILDDPNAKTAISISASTPSVVEGSDTAVIFVISRTGSVNSALSVHFKYAGTPVPVASTGASSVYRSNIPQSTLDYNVASLWVNTGNAANESDRDDQPFISFTFDKIYTLSSVTLSNYNAGEHPRGAKDIEILTSTDGVNFVSGSTISLKVGNPNPALGFYETFPMNTAQALRVMLKIKTNWYGRTFYQGTSYEGTWANASITGLSEVHFFSTGFQAAEYTQTPTGNVIVIPKGAESATVSVKFNSDHKSTGNRIFILAIEADTTYVLGKQNSAQVIVRDKDASGVIVGGRKALRSYLIPVDQTGTITQYSLSGRVIRRIVKKAGEAVPADIFSRQGPSGLSILVIDTPMRHTVVKCNNLRQ